MLHLSFFKYQGAGNDFIIIDNRSKSVSLSTEQIRNMCDRHFGIGADGLMLLELCDEADFKMMYYNADGNESTMCGNGGRCIAAFAQRLNIVSDTMKFMAIDGLHHAAILPDGNIALQMQDVQKIHFHADFTELNTGSPHYVKAVTDLAHIDVQQEGAAIRHQSHYEPKGINVNFYHIIDGELHVRTYERGVEAETLACGTGVTAVAITNTDSATGNFSIPVNTRGGRLRVSFLKKTSFSAEDIQLTGPAQFVFEGKISV